jgi:hypothetical protein
MKTTIELPDQLMNEVKQVADREQRQVGDVVAELVRVGLEYRPKQLQDEDVQPPPEQWMLDWLAMADELMEGAPDGPTARDIIEEDRGRLDRG